MHWNVAEHSVQQPVTFAEYPASRHDVDAETALDWAGPGVCPPLSAVGEGVGDGVGEGLGERGVVEVEEGAGEGEPSGFWL